jgi:primosomal protein N'
MQKIEIELDQETFNKIEQLTQTHHCEVSDLIKAMIEQLTKPEIITNGKTMKQNWILTTRSNRTRPHNTSKSAHYAVKR